MDNISNVLGILNKITSRKYLSDLVMVWNGKASYGNHSYKIFVNKTRMATNAMGISIKEDIQLVSVNGGKIEWNRFCVDLCRL